MLFLIILGLITALALYIRHIYTYWQRRKFPTDESSIPFGCLRSVFKRERSFGMAINDVYQKSRDKFIGIYLMFRPALLIRDAEFARSVLVQDFPSFHDRGIYVDVENDPVSGNLFALQGDRWKTLRQKLTPSFTSGKLKGMFSTVDDVGNRMLDHLDKVVPDEGGAVIEMKELFSTYAVDIIASVIMGLEVDSFKEPKNKFKKISAQLNSPNLLNVLRGTAQFLCPPLEKMIVRFGIKDAATELMRDIVRQTVEFREKNNYSRKDLMQLLIQLRNTGKISLDDNIWDVESTADAFKSMSIDTITGQALLFYAAGFDTSASASAFTIYELSQNEDLMIKAQADVQQALDKHDGQLTYECIKDMKYLDLCFMETIRKYPGLPILNRECTKDFKIPGTDKVIEKGTPIVISLFGIHRDPEYFPDPMRYDPERFVETNQNYNPLAYMPFGEGPRHCIAQRMGKVNVKVALAKLLTNYNVEAVCKGELEIDNFSVTIVPKGGANVKLIKKKGSTAK